jgi:hypothetical protein
MARTYADFVSLVRDWANRDSASLSDAIIKDALNYAADKAYRKLRISALEATVTYNATDLRAATTDGTGLVSSRTEITAPVDLIEFIQIREIDANENTTRIFNEKADLRTFNDGYGEKYNSDAYWSRQGNTIILAPGFEKSFSLGTPDKIELHYYRRLPALNATYDVNVANYNAGFLDVSSAGVTDAAPLYFNSNTSTTAYATSAAAQAADPAGLISITYYIGQETYNWLRDENERVLLMGALAECFAYLQDDEQAQKYMGMFQNEIAELNDEDAQRNASGGNIQIHFNGRGLI